MNIRETIEDLMHELNLAIDEVNTMRDIHHTDNLTPADHWDKETLHNAQLSLRDFVEESCTPLTDRIETHHYGNINAFALAESYHVTQVKRYLAQGADIENGRVYFKKYMIKKESNNEKSKEA